MSTSSVTHSDVKRAFHFSFANKNQAAGFGQLQLNYRNPGGRFCKWLFYSSGSRFISTLNGMPRANGFRKERRDTRCEDQPKMKIVGAKRLTAATSDQQESKIGR